MHHQDIKVAILLAEMYEDPEFWYPYYRLKEAGAKVVVVGSKADVYHSKHGYPAKADISVEFARPEDFDALVIPGGFSPDFMRRDEWMIEFVRGCTRREGMVIAAICHGLWVLCSTDFLKGKRCTSFPSVRWDCINAGAQWVDEPCVVDGNLISSRRPDDLPLFCNNILKALNLVDEFEEVLAGR